jgi:hypothetical protein
MNLVGLDQIIIILLLFLHQKYPTCLKSDQNFFELIRPETNEINK